MKLRTGLFLIGLPLALAALRYTIPNANAQAETNLHSFSHADGFAPLAGLIQGSDGNFYGTASGGGTSNFGTVFRMSPSGSFTNLHSFVGDRIDGAHPTGGLVQGSDSNFYGTTEYGGTGNNGTIFRISASGSYTNLYSFPDYPTDGGMAPYAGLVRGNDGNFYGTTEYGGNTNSFDGLGYGTVYRISPSGTYTSLYSFAGFPTDGANPYAGLVQGSDGNLYGTTFYGGTNGDRGTVFRISPSGSYTMLHSFGGSYGEEPDGENPQAGLVEGSDGNFYGTTTAGGGGSAGNVFRISPTGTYVNLRFFGWINNGSGANEDGRNANGLVQGSDGNFYGTTAQGGTNNSGSVFQINPVPISATTNYSYAILCSFGSSPGDGRVPSAGLVQGSDGNFYGTTSGAGTVFRLSVPLSPPANQISGMQFFNVLDSTIVAVPIPSVAGETYQLQYSDSMSPTNWLNTGGTITSIGGPLVLTDIAEPLPPQRFYRAVITP